MAEASSALRTLTRRAHMLLPGLYAWTVTVATPVTQRGAGPGARACAVAALVALVAGPLLVTTRPLVARIIGVHAFLGACLITWALLGPLLTVSRLDPLRGMLGAFAWALFAFGWGSLRELGHVPEDDPRAVPGPALTARSRLPAGSAVVLATGVVLALGLSALAWRVTRPGGALLAHAAAVLSGIALIAAATSIALDRGTLRRQGTPRQRFDAATVPLSALALLLSLGFLYFLLR
jgi:hypothetical protein